MSEPADPDRGEPIDVEWEPAERRRAEAGGVSMRTAMAFSVAAAVAGGALGALGSKAPPLQALDLKPSAPLPAIASADPSLSARLAAIEARWRDVDVSLAGVETNDFSARIVGVQKSLVALENRLNGADLSAVARDVAALKAETDEIRAQSDAAARAARAAFAVAAASEAARGSQPFVEAQATLRVILPSNPDVAALAPYAAAGAPSRQELKDGFARIERDVLNAARVSQAGTGLWARIVGFFAENVTIRHAGDGGGAVERVERASARLADDDLAGAVAEMTRLPGPPARVAQPWLAQARARLEIDARLAAIRLALAQGRMT